MTCRCYKTLLFFQEHELISKQLELCRWIPTVQEDCQKDCLSKLGSWAVVAQARMSDPGYIPDWTGVTWALPQASDYRLLPTEGISSVPSAQPGFVNASCPRALPACWFCFRQSIKEQNSAHNSLCVCFPVTQPLWQVCFKDYRFWCRLVAMLGCQSRVRGEDVTEMMSVCRTKNKKEKKKSLVKWKALGLDKGKPSTGS